MDTINDSYDNDHISQSNQQKINKNSKFVWEILLNTNEFQDIQRLNLIDLFGEFKTLGSYFIEKVESMSSNDSETWSITLITEATYNTITSMLNFLEKDCTIIKLAEGIDSLDELCNIFNNKQKEKEISILDTINNIIKEQSKS